MKAGCLHFAFFFMLYKNTHNGFGVKIRCSLNIWTKLEAPFLTVGAPNIGFCFFYYSPRLI